MQLRMTSEALPAQIYPGLIITYKVSPLLGLPLSWMTEITAVSPGKYFVDEQRKGPFRFWHHQHLFEEQGPGVLMTDIVHYRLPLGPLGSLAHQLFVKKELQALFAFREQVLNDLFRRQRHSDLT